MLSIAKSPTIPVYFKSIFLCLSFPYSNFGYMGIPKCPLCENDSTHFFIYLKRDYFRCNGCNSIFVDPDNLLGYENEKERYLEHNNDVFDPGYRNFVRPLVDVVISEFTPQHLGLDFGAGPGPVISQMLKEKAYNIVQYDPFFCNNIDLLTTQYDYIVCCEVIEHFNKPSKEFAQLRSMLKPGGELICMTDIYTEDVNFLKWYYKNDPTHVFFYHQRALEYIADKFGFSSLDVNGRRIRFKA